MVNGKIIYPLKPRRPVIVPLQVNRAQIVVTDGFHITQPFEVAWQNHPIQHLMVACAIDDEQLIMGFILLLLFYAAGLTSDILFLKVLSFIPLLIFLFIYYIKREAFIKIISA